MSYRFYSDSVSVSLSTSGFWAALCLVSGDSRGYVNANRTAGLVVLLIRCSFLKQPATVYFPEILQYLLHVSRAGFIAAFRGTDGGSMLTLLYPEPETVIETRMHYRDYKTFMENVSHNDLKYI